MTEKLDIRIEVEDDSVLLVFPRKLDDCIVPWQQAMQLGEVLEHAAGDVPTSPKIINPAAVNIETEQVQLNTDRKGHVAMFFEHTDRIKLSPPAAVIVARALRKMAQDGMLEERQVFTEYVTRGPDKGMVKRLVNRRLDYEQIVRE